MKDLKMDILRKSFMIGVAAIGIGASAFSAQAQEAPRKHEYAATKFDPAKHAEHFQQRQQKLHDALKLTAQQEPAWQTYIAAIQPKQPVGRADRASFKDLPAPQRMEKWLEFSRARLQQQESHLAALKTFYATLTPEQQKIFDQKTPGGHGLHRGDMHRRG
jgi:Spy/CpxP family protein refolding chaperone